MLGVTAIHQETVLFDELTVAENIFLGHAPRTRLRTIDWQAMNSRAKALLTALESNIDPTIRLKDLSIAQRHLVAIARALSIEARIVIMDEPTAALSRKEIDDLFRIVRGLKEKGKAILFISHKFDEVYEIADDFVVFRDGRAVGQGLAQGNAAGRDRPHDGRPRRRECLSEGRCRHRRPGSRDPQLQPPHRIPRHLLHPAPGRDSRHLRPDRRRAFGTVPIALRHHQAALGHHDARGPRDHHPFAAGCDPGLSIVYVPEERGRHGLALPMPIFQNMTLPSLARTSRRGFLRAANEFALARKYAERLDLRAAALSVPVGTLSGGNQQKVVIGKWLATAPKVIILDEPTKGIDIGSKAAVHGFISELAAEGLSIIMVSSELPEIIGMSDRVLVMKEGLAAGIFDRAELSPEALVRAATGNT